MSGRYVIYKTIKNYLGSERKILVNDDEGIHYEFDDYDVAKATAELFQSRTKQDATYEVKEI